MSSSLKPGIGRSFWPSPAENPPDVSTPAWYMPAPVAGARSPWQRVVGLAFVGALVLINVSGLCVTYGVIELA